MPMRSTTPALVLRTRDYGEKDRWVTLLTPEDGRVDVLAKGVRSLTSKRRSALQAGNLIRCSWTSKGQSDFHILTETTYEESLFQITGSLDRVRDFTAVLEIVHYLALEAFEQEEYAASAIQVLRYVGQASEYNRAVVRKLLMQLAEMQGVVAEHQQRDQMSASDVLESVLGRKIRSFAYFRV